MEEHIEPDFEVWEFSRDKLYDELKNKYFTIAEVREHAQARYLYEYLADPEMRANIIVVENEYTDKDYLDDFAAYHVKCHENYKRHCKRIHFFSIGITEEKPKGMKPEEFKEKFLLVIRKRDEKEEEPGKEINPEYIEVYESYQEIKRGYLGFAVVRPLPITIIGRTLIRTYPEIKIIHETGEKRPRTYCKIKDGKVNLFGVDLTIESLAFMEQDRTLAACATIALWTCFQSCGKIFHTPVLSPREITTFANETYQKKRAIPSTGLNIEQVAHAIKKNFLEPGTFQIKNNLHLKSVLYAYLKYNLPVFLGGTNTDTGCGHAIALSGFSLYEKTPLENEIPGFDDSPIGFTASKIDRFYAHDDNIGAYVKYYIRRPNVSYEKTKDGFQEVMGSMRPKRENTPFILWRMPTYINQAEQGNEPLLEMQDQKPMRFLPTIAMVPLYHKIRVTVVEVQRWICLFSVLLSERNLLEDLKMDKLEWDIYLTEQKNIKSDLAQTLKNDPKKLETLRTKNHPKYIWRGLLKYGDQNLIDLLGDATDIGGFVNPFYEVIFYNKTLGWKLAQLFTEDRYKEGVVFITRQLDGFFYRYFMGHPIE